MRLGFFTPINVFWLIISPSHKRALHVSWLVKAIPQGIFNLKY